MVEALTHGPHPEIPFPEAMWNILAILRAVCGISSENDCRWTCLRTSSLIFRAIYNSIQGIELHRFGCTYWWVSSEGKQTAVLVCVPLHEVLPVPLQVRFHPFSARQPPQKYSVKETYDAYTFRVLVILDWLVTEVRSIKSETKQNSKHA